jgi:hypothetical protein
MCIVLGGHQRAQRMRYIAEVGESAPRDLMALLPMERAAGSTSPAACAWRCGTPSGHALCRPLQSNAGRALIRNLGLAQLGFAVCKACGTVLLADCLHDGAVHLRKTLMGRCA